MFKELRWGCQGHLQFLNLNVDIDSAYYGGEG